MQSKKKLESTIKASLDEEHLVLCMHNSWSVTDPANFQDINSFVTSQVGRNIEEAVLEETDKALHITIDQMYEEINEKKA